MIYDIYVSKQVHITLTVTQHLIPYRNMTSSAPNLLQKCNKYLLRNYLNISMNDLESHKIPIYIIK